MVLKKGAHFWSEVLDWTRGDQNHCTSGGFGLILEPVWLVLLYPPRQGTWAQIQKGFLMGKW